MELTSWGRLTASSDQKLPAKSSQIGTPWPPLDFSDPDGLRRSMEGAGVFYNTYWTPFAHGRTTFYVAVENTRTLFKAAKKAGVGRIVHFSVTNASPESRLPYFRVKAQVEDMLTNLRVPYAIIRPTLVFGVGDLLLKDMAWALRRFPVFPVYGEVDPVRDLRPICPNCHAMVHRRDPPLNVEELRMQLKGI